VLWSTLRDYKRLGYHFRRQVPIGRYVADFACHRAKLIVELDGAQHNEKRQKDRDAVRTAFLESRGYKIVRVWNNEVFRNSSGICDYILALAKEQHPHPHFAPARFARFFSILPRRQAPRAGEMRASPQGGGGN